MKSFSAPAVSRWSHMAAIALMALFVVVATGVGFTQSWAGLYGWATGHGLAGWKAMSFPAMVDLFILVGELGLFTLSLEGVTRKSGWASYLLPAAVTVAGWSVSLVFNVGHVKQNVADQFTAAVPPVASMVGLFLLLQTLHRQVLRVRADESAALEVEAPEEPAPAVVEGKPVMAEVTAPAVAEEAAPEPPEVAPIGDQPNLPEVVEEAPVKAQARPSVSRPKPVPARKPTTRKKVVPPAVADVMRLHRNGVKPREIAIKLDTTRYQVEKALRGSKGEVPGQLGIAG